MKVGEYVRTKDGDLFILDDIIDNEVIPRYIHLPYAVWENEIIKSSPNIIDLIEVGDYVNGYLVEKVYQPINKELGKIIEFSTDNVEGWEYEAKEIYENEIKTVVTKEQFLAMEYKVESEVK